MECPFCFHEIAETWIPFAVLHDVTGAPLPADRVDAGVSVDLDDNFEKPDHRAVYIMAGWMQCPNKECRELLVTITRRVYNPSARMLPGRVFRRKEPQLDESWLAVPRRRPALPVNPLVPEGYRRDYQEASLILDDSPRMSAVLSRRVLSDLLESYANLTDYRLSDRIDKFITDTSHPSTLRDNLHYLRKMGDFGAHTKTDPAGDVIHVDRNEAEWTLRVVDRLFDYFIVGPAKDKAMREAFDGKLKQAGQPPMEDAQP